MKKIRLLAVRTQSGLRLGYDKHVSKVLSYTGNAYHGFEVILEDGTKIPLLHFNFEYAEGF